MEVVLVIVTSEKKYDTLEDDNNLVSFFKEVLSRRDALDDDNSGDLAVTGVLLATRDPADLDASQFSPS